MKLRSKLALVIVPLIAGPLFLVGLLSFFQLKESATSQVQNQEEALLQQLQNELTQQLESAYANVRIFSSDPLLKSYLLTEDLEERYALFQRPLQKKLQSIQKVYPDYYEIRILLPDGYEDLRTTRIDIPNYTEEEGDSSVFKNAAQSTEEISSQIAINPDNGEPSLYVTKRITLIQPAYESFTHKPTLRGYLSLTIKMRPLIEQLKIFPWAQGGIALTDSDGNILLNSKNLNHDLLSNKTLSMLLDRAGTHQHLSPQDTHDYSYNTLKLREDLWAHLLIPETVLLSESWRIGQLVLMVCLGTVALSIPLLLLLLQRHFLTPIEHLNTALSRLSKQPQLIQIPVNSGDEIGELGRSFNKMSTALHRSSEKIRALAFNDNLTGLPNRLFFIKTLRQRIKSNKHQPEQIAVLFMDLDNFKHVNDTLGHSVGDQLLIKVSSMLQRTLQYTPELTTAHDRDPPSMISRLGGDEFTLLLSHLQAREKIQPIAEKIVATLSQPLTLNDTTCYIGCSIGIAVYPEDGRDAESLLKHADLAMYKAKTSGKGVYQFFSNSLAQSYQHLALLDQRLHYAVEAENFSLVYQPIFDRHTEQVKSVEALIRWHDKELGSVSPDEFIPAAEDNGLIVPIGLWVMEEACRQLREWHRTGLEQVKVGLNISSVQLSQPGLAKHLNRTLRSYQLSPKDIYIELTETALLKGPEQVVANLNDLRALGVQIALDDFGTGYSSLSYLQNLPIDILKIDRSFIVNIQESNNSLILSAVITMAHSLNMKVVAEGVSTEQQLVFLSSEGCDLFQGFLFSRPLAASGITELLRKTEKPSSPIVNTPI